MSRSPSKRPKPSEAADPARLAAAIREKIAGGRSMGALQDANRYCKDHPGAEARAVLAEAYRARIDALAGSGMQREAEELIAVARTRLPELGAAWEQSVADLAVHAGDLDGLLREWLAAAAAEPLRAAVHAKLQRSVTDPRQVLRSGVLPTDDPLRRDAAAVQEAFTQAAAGPLGAQALAALQQVPRRSPLSPWRQFVLALAAWQRGDDAAATALLERIPAGSAPARLQPVLGALVRGERPTSGIGPAAGWLIDKGSAGLLPARASARKLRTAIADGNKRRTTEAVLQTLVLLGPKSPHLAARLARWVVREFDHDAAFDFAAFDEALLRALPPGERDRLSATDVPPPSPAAAFFDWYAWLLPDERLRLRLLPHQELALVLDRLATVTDGLVRWLANELQKLGLDAEQLTHLTALPGLARELDALTEDIPWLEVPAGGAVRLLARLLVEVHDHAGLQLPSACHPATALARCATHLAPAPERFRDLAARVRQEPRSHDERDAVLQDWARHFPQDVEPLLLAAESAEARGAHVQALAAIERAAALDPLHEKVRAAQFRILIGNLGIHLRRGQHAQCAKDLQLLAELPAAGTPERRRYLAAARLHLVQETGSPPDVVGTRERELLEAAGDAAAAQDALLLLRADALAVRPPAVLPVGDTGPARLVSLVRLVRMARAVFGSTSAHVGLPPLGSSWPASEPPAVDDLLLLSEHALEHHDWDTLHLLAGAGLLEPGPLLARFLFFRSLSLSKSGMRRQAVRCARAAHHHANRHQDGKTIGALHEAFPWLLDEGELDAAERDDVLRHERKYQCPASLRKDPTGGRTADPEPASGGRRGRRREHRAPDNAPRQKTLFPSDPGELPI